MRPGSSIALKYHPCAARANILRPIIARFRSHDCRHQKEMQE